MSVGLLRTMLCLPCGQVPFFAENFFYLVKRLISASHVEVCGKIVNTTQLFSLQPKLQENVAYYFLGEFFGINNAEHKAKNLVTKLLNELRKSRFIAFLNAS